MKATLASASKLEGVPNGAELVLYNDSHDTLSIVYTDEEKRMRKFLLGHPEVVFLHGNSLHITGLRKGREPGTFIKVRFIVNVN